ncbi:MAG: tautomerase family protein [Solirubrobacteraceae bacterium]
MPEVHVYMAAGRTDEQKKGMMLDITQALVDNLAVSPEVVTVQIIEAPLTDKMKKISRLSRIGPGDQTGLIAMIGSEGGGVYGDFAACVLGLRTFTRSLMMWKSPVFSVRSGTLWTFAVAAIARSIVRLRGWPPRVLTAAASRPHSRATSAVIGRGSKVASIAPKRCVRIARSLSSPATRTPKCSSAIEATLTAASTSLGAVSLIRIDVSSSARMATQTDR